MSIAPRGMDSVEYYGSRDGDGDGFRACSHRIQCPQPSSFLFVMLMPNLMKKDMRMNTNSKVMPSITDITSNQSITIAISIPIAEIDLSPVDFVRHHEPLKLSAFRQKWEAIGNWTEVIKKLPLGQRDMQGLSIAITITIAITIAIAITTTCTDAVDAVSSALNMHVVERSGEVQDGARTHAMNLIGEFLGGHTVLTRCGFMNNEKKIVLKVR